MVQNVVESTHERGITGQDEEDEDKDQKIRPLEGYHGLILKRGPSVRIGRNDLKRGEPVQAMGINYRYNRCKRQTYQIGETSL